MDSTPLKALRSPGMGPGVREDTASGVRGEGPASGQDGPASGWGAPASGSRASDPFELGYCIRPYGTAYGRVLRTTRTRIRIHHIRVRRIRDDDLFGVGWGDSGKSWPFFGLPGLQIPSGF